MEDGVGELTIRDFTELLLPASVTSKDDVGHPFRDGSYLEQRASDVGLLSRAV